MNQIIRINMEDGTEARIARDDFAAIVKRREPAEIVDELISAVCVGRHVYITAGCIYEARLDRRRSEMTTAQEQRVAAKYSSGLSWKQFDATAEGQRLAAEADRERAADAKLIAAAPELLELLENVLRRLDLEPVEAIFPCSAMREDIRAAIAKARGK